MPSASSFGLQAPLVDSAVQCQIDSGGSVSSMSDQENLSSEETGVSPRRIHKKRQRSVSPSSYSIYSEKRSQKNARLAANKRGSIRKSPRKSGRSSPKRAKEGNGLRNVLTSLFHKTRKSASPSINNLSDMSMEVDSEHFNSFSSANSLLNESLPSTPHSTSRHFFPHSPISSTSSTSGYFSGFTHSPSPLSDSLFSHHSEKSFDFEHDNRTDVVFRARPSLRSMTPVEVFETVPEEEEKPAQADVVMTDVSPAASSEERPEGLRRSMRNRRCVIPFTAVMENFMTNSRKRAMPLRRFVGKQSVQKAQQQNQWGG